MGWNPVKEAEKKAKQAVDKVIRPATKAAIGAVDKACDAATHEAEDALWKLRRESYAKLKAVGGEMERAVRKAGDEVEDGLTEKLPDLIEDAAEKLAREAAKGAIKEALENATDVIEMMAPTRFTIIFGVELALVVQGEVTVAVALPNPAAKLTEIRKWADKPPRGRAQIVACIRDFAPESLSVEAKVSGNGIAAEWDGDDKFDRIDAFLAKHGVD